MTKNMEIPVWRNYTPPEDGDCVLPEAPYREFDDFCKSPLQKSSRGSYTSPALALPATPL